MKFSIFTPTHDVRFLKELHWSIQQQDVSDYEWVILPSRLPVSAIPEEIRRSPHVRILDPLDSDVIGLLKRRCCTAAVGDILVEADHDDLLVPGILRKVGEAADQGAGFIYSDFAEFSTDAQGNIQQLQPYDLRRGWETYEAVVYGTPLVVYRAFAPKPRALSEIYYSANHIRAWTREAYLRAGGHPIEWSVVDDFALITLTYNAGVKFAHLHTCGYLYRRHDNNSSSTKAKLIALRQRGASRKQLAVMVAQWCRRTDHPYLDLSEQWLQFDWQHPSLGVKELSEPDTVGCVYIDHTNIATLDLPRWTALRKAAYRALAADGWLVLVWPKGIPKFAAQSRDGFQMVHSVPRQEERTQYLTAVKGQRIPGLYGHEKRH